jgi:hypothetical protein
MAGALIVGNRYYRKAGTRIMLSLSTDERKWSKKKEID